MVRYRNRTDHQTKALFRGGARVQVVTSKQLCDAVYKKLCAQRYFTHHAVDRITVKEFLTVLGIQIGPRAQRLLTRRVA